MDGTSTLTARRDRNHFPSTRLSINGPIRILRTTKRLLRLRTTTPPPQILQIAPQAIRMFRYIRMVDAPSSLFLRWYFHKRRNSPPRRSQQVKQSEPGYLI